MPKNEHIARRGGRESEPEAVEQTTTKRADLDDAIDQILDEIDEVLEQNAEEFVRSFVQKGGQ